MVAMTRRTVLTLVTATLVGLLFTSQLYVWINWWPISIGWGTALVWSLPQLMVWAATIPVVVLLGRAWPIEEPVLPSRLVLHAVASVVMAFGGLLLVDLSDRLWHWSLMLGAPN